MRIGLRIDVDTLRGTRDGVPELCRICQRHGIRASFFFSLGPDNMGRHLWRLLRPRFTAKMLRTRASKLYGWDILLRGTLLPGPIIGRRAADPIRLAAAGHEVGLHAWDHHAWQTRVERMRPAQIFEHLERGVKTLEGIAGRPVSCSAAPAWRSTDEVLRQKRRFGFRYNSDCRGDAPFLPLLEDGTLGQPQIPSNLPTFDECVGRDGVSERGYYDGLTRAMREQELNVLTIHAEVEGIACSDLFEELVERSLAEGYRFLPLGDLVDGSENWPVARIERREIPGREGWVSCRQRSSGERPALEGGGVRLAGGARA